MRLTRLLAVMAVLAAVVSLSVPASGTQSADALFVRRAYTDFLKREPTTTELSSWTAKLASGTPRSRLVSGLAASTEWLSVVVGDIYRQALDRGPDPGGLAYWVGKVRAGALVNDVGASVFGSAEFWKVRSQSSTSEFVSQLYSRILGRTLDSAGLAYWTGRVAELGRAKVAASFYASKESRSQRVTILYERLLCRSTDTAGLGYWAGRLTKANDVTLASLLATSGEYYGRPSLTCPPLEATVAGTSVAGRAAVFTVGGVGVTLTSITPPAGVLAGAWLDETGLHLDVPTGAAGTTLAGLIPAKGCRNSVCDQHVKVSVSVAVKGPTPVTDPEMGLTDPSADRLLPAGPDEPDRALAVVDEVEAVMSSGGQPATPLQAQAIAAAQGAMVIGGIPEIGYYQLLYPPGTHLDDALVALAAVPGVQQANKRIISLLSPSGVTTNTPPEWTDLSADKTWHLRQINATSAWVTTTGTSVPVGVIDTTPIKHPDLNVVSRKGRTTRPGDHGTMVAGLACARKDGRGIVGAAWGCPIHSADPYAYDQNGVEHTDWPRVAEQMLRVLKAKPRPKVVNLSLSEDRKRGGCWNASEAARINGAISEAIWTTLFANIMAGPGNDVVWVFAAGNNCIDRVVGGLQQAAIRAPNAIVVASVNQDRRLSSFSQWGPGVTVAAPGGTSSTGAGVWSTSIKSKQPSYRADTGTSRAAPLVTGTVALVAQDHPTYTATQLANCIKNDHGPAVTSRSDQPNGYTLGTGVTPPTAATLDLHILDAANALACPSSAPWNAERDFRNSPRQANPTADQFGNPDVWIYGTSHRPEDRLPIFNTNTVGCEGLETWQTDGGYPAVGIYPAGFDCGGVAAPTNARTLIMHPAPEVAAVTTWRAPSTGTFDVQVLLESIDTSGDGDGIGWSLDIHRASGQTTNLKSGRIDNGEASGPVAASITVTKGDALSLAIDSGPVDYYLWDTTAVRFLVGPLGSLTG